MTQAVVRLAAVLLGAAIALAGEPLFGILAGGGMLGALEGARRWRIHRLTTSLFGKLIKLVRADEYEGDRVQDRRLIRRILRGDFTASLFTTHREEIRATPRAGKYITLQVTGGGIWPTTDDVTAVRVRWAPYIEISRKGMKTRILAQVGDWYERECEVVGGFRDGWHTHDNYVWIRPKAFGDLPTEVAYPGPDDHTPRFTTEELEP